MNFFFCHRLVFFLLSELLRNAYRGCGSIFSIERIQFLVPFVLREHIKRKKKISTEGTPHCHKHNRHRSPLFFSFFPSTFSIFPELLRPPPFPSLLSLPFPLANRQHEFIQELILKDTTTTFHYHQHKHHNQRPSQTIPPRHFRNPQTHILLSRRPHPPPLRRLCLSPMAPSKPRSSSPQCRLGHFLEQGENAHLVCEAGWRCPVLVLLLF